MNIDELNAKYDEIFNKNAEIQQLLTELEDYCDILFFLYNTDIKRPNAVLNTMIDTYESLIFKIRESHKDIKASLAEFGDEKELAEGINNNDNLTDKVKELILWKLRRLFMVYDEEPILPYVTGDFLNTELIGDASSIPAPQEPGADRSSGNDDDDEEEEEYDRFSDPAAVTPDGGVFPDKTEKN